MTTPTTTMPPRAVKIPSTVPRVAREGFKQLGGFKFVNYDMIDVNMEAGA